MAACADAEVVSTISPQTTRPDTAPRPFEAPAGVVAPSSPMARAARAFGDAYPPIRGHWFVRCAGIAYLASAAIYMPWLFATLNRGLPWLAWPFLAANLFTLATTMLSIFNHWWRTRARAAPAASWSGAVGRHHRALLRRAGADDSAHDHLGARAGLAARANGDRGQRRRPRPGARRAPSAPGRCSTTCRRHAPHPAATAPRRPATSTRPWAVLVAAHPELGYIETRDCDDELGSNQFLRQAVGQLEHDQRLAFVQTIKETQVSAGDPFNNREAMFYRGPDALALRRQRDLPVRLGPRLAALGARADRPVPDLEPRRGPAVGRRGAAPRLGQLLPADRRRDGSALPRGRAERLQAARHLGDRHRAPDALGRPARPEPASARAVL